MPGGRLGTVGDLSPYRYRCTACGNLTRFDVTIARRTAAFHHYSVGGDLTVEDEQVLDETGVRLETELHWVGFSKSDGQDEPSEGLQ